MTDNLKEREAFESALSKNSDVRFWNTTDAMFWAWSAALAQAQSCVPAERIEELEILAARWTQLEYMYGRGIAPDTIAHYIGRPERLDYLVQLRREHGSLAASPQPQPVQPSEHVGVFREDDDIGHVDLCPHQQMKLRDGDLLYAAPQPKD